LRRRTKQTSIKRRVFLFIGVLLLLSGLVVAVRFHRTEPLIEPEPPELTAKRTSPDNAYYAFDKLAQTLPDTPKPQRVKPDPIAAHMSIRREDDDPEMMEYLKATRPIAENVVQILEKKTYYCAPVESIENTRKDLIRFRNLFAILRGHALYAEKNGEPEKAVEFVLAALRLGAAMAKDGPLENVDSAATAIAQTSDTAMCLPWEDYSEEQLREFLKALDELQPANIDLSHSLDWEFRLVEAGVYNAGEEEQSRGLGASLREAIIRRFLRKHETELRAAATLSYPELDDWSTQHRRVRRRRRRHSPMDIMTALLAGVRNVTNAATQVEGLRAVVGLEQYKKTHGEYPESLDALTPEFLDSVPVDAYSTEPLRYSRKNDSYQVYSVGRDGNNDDGDPKRDVLYPPACAATFKASLKNPVE
jgi:hypothetical protein